MKPFTKPKLFNYSETDTENVRIVKDYLINNKQSLFRILHEKDETAKKLKKIVLDATSYASDEFFTFTTRMYFFLNGYTEFPKCERCGKPINNYNVKVLAEAHKFPHYCSNVCKYNNADVIKHRLEIAERNESAKKFTDDEMKEQLKQVIKEHPFNHVTHINAKDNWWSFLHDWIMKKTSNLDEHYTMHTRIGWILNDYNDFPKCECPTCNHTFEGHNIDRGTFRYPRFCSQKCQMNTPSVKEQIAATKAIVYGDRTMARKKEIAAEKCEENRKLSDSEKIEIIKSIIKENPKNFDRVLKSKCTLGKSDDNSYLIEFINEKTPLLQDEKYLLKTKIYWILNGITDFPKCKICGKYLDCDNVVTLEDGYRTYCSTSCEMKDEEIVKKSKQTKLELYGDENYSNHAKAVKTLMNKSEEEKADIRRRIVATMIERYGVDNIHKCPEIKEKIRKTCLERFGCENPASSPLVRAKYIQTCKERYGCENAFQNDGIKKKIADTNVEKYGAPHPSQCHEIQYRSKKKYLYNGIFFHSSWELAYYIWLVDNHIEFVYQPKDHLSYIFEGVEHHYCPDFMVDGKLIEIKGGQFFDDNGKLINPYYDDHGKSAAKQKCMTENNVIIMTEKEITQYINYVEEQYGKEYLKSFRKQ